MTPFEAARAASIVRPVVVLITSTTCGPCKAFKPVVNALAADLNFSLCEITATQQLCAALGVRSVPTVIVLNQGLIAGSFAGTRSKEELHRFLDANGVTQTQLDL